jgi:hypothetical protein
LGVVRVLQASAKDKEGGKFKVNLTCHGFCLFFNIKNVFFPYFSDLLDFFIFQFSSIIWRVGAGGGGFHLLLFYHPSLVIEQKSINVH